MQPSGASVDGATPGHDYRTVVNYRFLGIVVGIVLATTVIAFLWHGRQVRRLSTAFLDQASAAEEEQDWSAAIKQIEQYLLVHPGDTAAQIRLAESFGRVAQSPAELERAVRLYDRAIGLSTAQQRYELQLAQAQAMIKLGRFAEAADQAEQALQSKPGDADALRTRALGQYYQFQVASSGDAGAVLKSLEAARAANPTDGELAVAAASLLRNTRGSADEADRIVDAMLEAAGDDPAALMAAYAYRIQQELDGADLLLDRALRLAPERLDVLMAAAARTAEQLRLAVEAGDSAAIDAATAESRQFYDRLVDAAPRDARVYVSRARDLVLLEQTAEALDVIDQGLETAGPDLMLQLMNAELLIQQSDLPEAEKALADLDATLRPYASAAKRGVIADILHYRDMLRAQHLLATGRRHEAVVLLRTIQADNPAANGTQMGAGIQSRVLNLVASLAAQQADWSTAAAAYDDLVRDQRDSVPLRMAAAEAWLRAGKASTAERRYQDLLELGEPLTAEQQATLGVGLARAAYSRTLATAPARRNWGGLASTLQQARTLAPDAFLLALIEADVIMTPGARPELTSDDERRAAAVKLLQEAEPTAAESPDALARLALAYQKLGEDEAADHALDRLKDLVETGGTVVLVEAEIARLRGDTDGASQLLDEFISQEPEAPQAPVVALRRARLKLEAGQRDEFIELLKSYARQYRSDQALAVALLEALLELPVPDGEQAAYFQELATWETHLRETGADQTVCDLYRAKRLLRQSKQSGDRPWLQAVRLQTDIEAARPSWSEPYLLLGQMRRLLGRHQSASEALLRAVSLGDQRPTTLVLLIDSLYRQGRFAEAADYLAFVEPLISVSEGLSELAISVAGGAGSASQAVAYARQRVAESPNEPSSYVWLGYALTFADQRDEAEEAFKEAVAMDPASPIGWNGLLAFYLRNKQIDAAEAVLQQMAAEASLPETEKDFLIGQGYEILGKLPEAESRYREAFAAAPDNAVIGLRLARLIAGQNPQEAISILRKLPDQTPEVRRALAALLATVGGDANWREALELLGSNSSDDRRARAFLLAARGDAEGRELARELFEQLVGDEGNARNEDRLILARLYEYEDQDALAREQFRLVASQTDARAAEVAAFVDFLIRKNDLDDAAIWLAQFKTLDADPLLALSLEVRLAAAQGRDAAIEPLLDDFYDEFYDSAVDDGGETPNARLLAKLAELSSEIQRYDLSEKYLSRIQDQSPAAYLGVALARAKQGATVAAVQMCVERYQATGEAVDLQSIAMVLLIDPKSSEANALADPALSEAVAKFKDQPSLLNLVGAVRHLQGRVADALAIYQVALEVDPDSLLTLNNLATLLSEQPDRLDAALKFVDAGLERSPENPMLLDTKAVILYFANKPAEARKLLAQVVRMRGADSRTQFHLALVELKLGNTAAARRWFEKAVEARIRLEVLTPKEAQLLEMLQNAVAPQTSNNKAVGTAA